MDENTVARFWSKVDKNGTVPANRPELGPCWVWTGYRRGGYGAIWHKNRNLPAHRVAYTLTHGPVPEGKIVCHHCDDPYCVNPDHLFAGTHSDNVQDMLEKGRMPVRRGETCPTAKLTPEIVREIRASAEPGTVWARRLGVSPAQIRRIRLRQQWAHIE